MLIDGPRLLEFLESEQSAQNGRHIAKVLRGIMAATPECDLFPKDPEAARREEVRKLRKLKVYLRKYARDCVAQMGILLTELD